MSRDFSNVYGTPFMNKGELKRQIDDLIDEMRYATSSQNIGTLMLYVDARNKPAGFVVGMGGGGSGSAYTYSARSAAPFALTLGGHAATDGNFAPAANESGYETEIGFAAVLGKGFEFRYTDYYNEYRIYGDLNGGLGSASGTINLSYYDSYNDDEVDVPLGTFSDLSLKEYQGVKIPNFTWNFSLGEILDALESQDVPLYGAEPFENISGELKYTASGNRAGASIKLADGRDANVTVELSSVISDETNIAAPGGRDVVYARTYDFIYALDSYELLDNLETVAEKLENMGFDVYDLFYDLEENVSYLF
jgi:hypothetical protein